MLGLVRSASRLPCTRVYGTLGSAQLIDMEHAYAANTYAPLPVVFAEAHGAKVVDPEGKEYFDFLSAYSAVNQGHCNPTIVNALCEQAHKVCLASRAFHSDQLPLYAKRVTELFGYESMLPMNTGAEAVETGLKIARRWGYTKKGIPSNEAVIVSACFCFHGRTMNAISMSCDPEATVNFGPLVPGHEKVAFGDAGALDRKLAALGGNAAAFIVEPIQGEAGVIVPPEGYLREVREICSRHNVVYISDEVQTGIGRTGKLLCTDHEDVRPDIVLLGKAIGGGVMPVSVVLADKKFMDVMDVGSHGSTFGGNPLAAAVGMASLDVVEKLNLSERATVLGGRLMEALQEVQRKTSIVKEVRGKGLLIALELHSAEKTAKDLCLLLKERGLLAKPTHGSTIRFAPPLIMSDSEFATCVSLITNAIEDFEGMAWQDIPGATPRTVDPAQHCERCGKEMPL